MADPLGKATVQIDADISGVRKGVEGVKDELQGVDAAAEQTGAKVGSSFEKAGKRIEGSTSGVRKFVGSLTSVIGIAGGVVAAITSIVTAIKAVNDYFRDGAKLADEFSQTLDRVGSRDSSIEAVQKRLQEVSSELEYLEAHPLTIFGRDRDQIEQEIESLRKSLISMTEAEGRARSQREKDKTYEEQRKAYEEATRFVEKIRAQSEDIRISLLPEDEQIAANADRMVIEAIRAAGDSRLKDARVAAELEAYIQFVNRKTEIDLAAVRKRIAEEKAAELAKAKEVAAKYEEEMKAAFQRAADSLRFSLGDTFGDSGALVRALNDTTRAVRERGRI